MESGLLAACGVFSIQVLSYLQFVQYGTKDSRDGKSVGVVEGQAIIKSTRLATGTSRIFIAFVTT